MSDLDELQLTLGYCFQNLDLLHLALQHESYANEQLEPARSNERLEFLGDAVLGMLVSSYLYQRHPLEPEGKLAQMKAFLVSTGHLADKARALELGGHVRLGRGELLTDGRERVNLLADAFEALMGAVFLDGGLEAAEQLTMRYFREDMDDLSGARKDYKSLLQELTQRHFKALPIYEVVQEEGPPHDRIFQVQVQFANHALGEGSGRSKREASQKAACQALEQAEAQSPVWLRLLEELGSGEPSVEDPACNSGN